MIHSEVLKAVKRIELSTKKNLSSSMAGAYHSSFKGNGMEFSEVREYIPGDDVRLIDWNVTARARTPYIKKFVEERELTVILAVDVSASMDFGSQRHLKREVQAAVAALMAFTAQKNNDRVGLLLFSDRLEAYFPPVKGRQKILRLVRELLSFEPLGKGSNLSMAMDHLAKMNKRRSLICLMSDFYLHDDSNWSKSFKKLAVRHQVLPLVVYDKVENEIPNVGMVRFKDLETGRVQVVDTSYKPARDHIRAQQASVAKALRQTFGRLNARPVWIPTSSQIQDSLDPLILFFKRGGL